MPKYNVALVLTRRNAYNEAIAEAEANPGKPVMTGEEMNWRIFYSNIEASSKDRAARIAIEQFYRSEHRDIGHLGGARVESVDNPQDSQWFMGSPASAFPDLFRRPE
jgi:hypothetical protein